MEYDHEATDRALKGTGQTAANASQESVNFETVVLSMRYGLTGRMNINAALPWYSIESAKIQGAPYTKRNKGIGDLSVTGEYSFGSAPQFTLEAGAEFPTGNIDKTDQFHQRICDILALGSGTVDPIAGMSLWAPHAFGDRFDLYAQLRHRFSGGENKYGYRFGDQTSLDVQGYHSLGDTWNGGVRLLALHAQRDTWYGRVVPERGSSFVYMEPTVNTRVGENSVVGAYVRFPLYMHLEGSQMVAPYSMGLELTSDLTGFVDRLKGNAEGAQ